MDGGFLLGLPRRFPSSYQTCFSAARTRPNSCAQCSCATSCALGHVHGMGATLEASWYSREKETLRSNPIFSIVSTEGKARKVTRHRAFIRSQAVAVSHSSANLLWRSTENEIIPCFNPGSSTQILISARVCLSPLLPFRSSKMLYRIDEVNYMLGPLRCKCVQSLCTTVG